MRWGAPQAVTKQRSRKAFIRPWLLNFVQGLEWSNHCRCSEEPPSTYLLCVRGGKGGRLDGVTVHTARSLSITKTPDRGKKASRGRLKNKRIRPQRSTLEATSSPEPRGNAWRGSAGSRVKGQGSPNPRTLRPARPLPVARRRATKPAAPPGIA